VITSHIITALQTVVSRSSDPTIPSVLTFGKIASVGGATNVIPSSVKLEGTFRTYDEKWRKNAHAIMRQQAESIAHAFGGTCDFRIAKGYPALNNHEQLTSKAFQIATDLLGMEKVIELPMRMTAEDFAYYSLEIPAVFIRIGTSNKAKNLGAPLHTPTFDVDEACFMTSVPLMVHLVLSHQ
jgi:amidohydrolase